ncbi:MAG: hypothetical protein RRY73_00820 [Alistipes sp.]
MAKDGDIMDVMFGAVLEFFGWIFGLIIKLTLALAISILSLIGRGIKALFNKREEPTT